MKRSEQVKVIILTGGPGSEAAPQTRATDSQSACDIRDEGGTNGAVFCGESPSVSAGHTFIPNFGLFDSSVCLNEDMFHTEASWSLETTNRTCIQSSMIQHPTLRLMLTP